MHGERLYVGNLPAGITRQTLRELFGAHGGVVGVTFFRDARTNEPMGCAYVQMRSAAEASVCVARLDGFTLAGRTLRVAATGSPATAPAAEAPRPALFQNARTENVAGNRFFRPPPAPPRKNPRPRG